MNVLLVDDDPALVYYLREVLAGAGHDVVAEGTGKAAIERFERGEVPDLLIVDVAAPGSGGVELVQKAREHSPEMFVIILMAQHSVELAMRALELRANNFLLKPVRFETISGVLEKYASLHRSRKIRAEVARCVVRRSLTLRLENRLELLGEAVEFLLQQAGPALPEADRLSIQLGLYELLVNAVEHGNLGITFQEKRAALLDGVDQLPLLIRQRQQDPILMQRRVTVDFRFAPGMFEWVVEDEGDGFDWRNLPDPLNSAEDVLNGRGIFLARFQFDELTYLGRGNRVRAIKRTDTPA